LRATLPQDAAARCLDELPVLPAAIGERQVACFHADMGLPEPADARDRSEARR
jgi:hypothetical protein